MTTRMRVRSFDPGGSFRVFSGSGGIGVNCGEVELSGDEEQNSSHSLEASVSASFSLCGLEQPLMASMKPLVWRVWAHATIPSKCLRIMAATSFMGSTLERMTLLHH